MGMDMGFRGEALMNKSWPVFLVAVSLVMGTTVSRAETPVKDVSGMERLMGAPAGMAIDDAADESTIRLTPDKTKIVRLTQDAASVIVTNPAHASVLLDSPRLLVVMPRVPGSTSFTVLNKQGQIIAEKTVIVSAAAKAKYVRIRRMCDTGGAGCVPTAYFYCPDGCYEVLTVPPDNGATQVPEIPANVPAIETTAPAPPAVNEPVENTPPPPAPSTTQQVPAR
jgi:hypothetical protein